MTARFVKDNTARDTHQASRVIAGNCPTCTRVVVVFNNFEVWPCVECVCGWAGATDEVRNHVRLERTNLRGTDCPTIAPEAIL